MSAADKTERPEMPYNMDFSPGVLLPLALTGYALAAVGGLAFWKRPRAARWWSFGGALLAAACGLWASVAALAEGADGSSWSMELPRLIPYIPMTLRMDALGAFFTMLVSLLGVAISLYSLGYARGFEGRKNVAALGAFFNVLLLAITMVFVAGNAFLFLIAWEVMALAGFLLISFQHEKPETRDAGVLFFAMSHIGTGCLILGFLLLVQAAGSLDFGQFHAVGAGLTTGKRDAVFLLFLAGFGVKAGIVPLHTWLAAAHPVAPSNASALLSGALIKTGIYGITRACFDFLGPPPMWWGVTLLAIGTVSAVLGVLYALMQHDLKRLLAYHSIENIGIILMGLGAALMFTSIGHTRLATLALIAGLYHTINHAVFKSLLFLGAGAAQQAAGTRDMERLGGLARLMPWTALFFLVGEVAISGLPPLNGFVSEWLTYQSLLQGFGTTDSLIRLMFPISGALLALTGALAAACFVKAFGITFLGQPRSPEAGQARESSAAMLAGQGILVGACVFLGLCPNLFLRLFDPLTRQLTGEQLSAQLGAAGALVLSSGTPGAGTISMAGIVFAGLCLMSVPWLLRLLAGRRTSVRIGPTWDCGQQGLTPQMEYTATGFSKPIRMIFKTLFRPHREVQREYDFSPYFARTIRFEAHVEEIFETRIYRPLQRQALGAARRMRALQAGSLQAYLAYIFLVLLLLLMFAL